MTQSDRRRHPRIPMVTRVTHINYETVQYYHSLDLSMGGMFLRTRKPFRVDTELELDFELAEMRKRVQVTGRVVRTVEPDENNPDVVPGMGIAFTEVEEESLHLLEEFLSER